MLAERLCLDLADRPYGRDQAIVSLTLGAIAQVFGSPSFDVPASREPAKESLGLILSYGYGRE